MWMSSGSLSTDEAWPEDPTLPPSQPLTVPPLPPPRAAALVEAGGTEEVDVKAADAGSTGDTAGSSSANPMGGGGGAFGWHGALLLLLAWARSSLPETRRFTERAPSGDRGLLAVWRSPYRFRVLQLGAIWACTYAATQTSIAFWKEFAVSERGLDDHGVGLALTVASLGALPMVAAVGKLLDVLGRRRGSVIIYALTIVGIVAAYNLHGQWPLTAALVLGIFGASAVLPPLNAWSTELFPTELRSEAYGWANYVVGRSAYVLAPLLAGLAAQHVGWGPAVSATALGPLVALVLILWWLPETAGRELEETART